MKMVDLGLQMQAMGGESVLLSEIGKVLGSGQFINGHPVRELEQALARFADRRFGVACASGTDALTLALMAIGVRGGTVVVPAFGFPAAAESAIVLGAAVAFVDVRAADGMMDHVRLRALLKGAPKRPRAVVVMDMFGTPANYPELMKVCDDFGVPLIADAAQSFGSQIDGNRASRFGLMTTTSFFPAKPLGCYGDGGMVFTDDAVLADHLKRLRNHGMGAIKYEHELVGLNSRLDTLQAAVLLKKLEVFPGEIEIRNALADVLITEVKDSGLPLIPMVPPVHVKSTWACFSLIAKNPMDRAEYVARLESHGIPTAIHYPKPLSEQPAYKPHTLYIDACCRVSGALCSTIFQVPFHPYLARSDVLKIIEALAQS